ncbi:hypothetical protein S40288_11604 [Stachybotrys chartarum IBT 40288]|nr:hypothetical protein S40288_11604 [Stachybotrys chartarum IBT 40288]
MSSKYNFARNFTGQTLNYLCFNNGYHTVHHLHPGLHWSILPQKHQELIAPHIAPSLEISNILFYMWRSFIYPGLRLDYKGHPLLISKEENEMPDEPWFYNETETYSNIQEYRAHAHSPAMGESLTWSEDALERIAALVQHEISRIEAAQGRANRQASHHERAAAVAPSSLITALLNELQSRAHLPMSDDLQRFSQVCALQRSLRRGAGPGDIKIYGGIKYERKTTGLFTGKLASQGIVISIDDEDFVEYRVLTKPSFA